MYYTAVRLQFASVSLANSHAVKNCGELAKETRRVGEESQGDQSCTRVLETFQLHFVAASCGKNINHNLPGPGEL